MTLRVPADEDVDEIARIMSQSWPEPTDADQVRRWRGRGIARALLLTAFQAFRDRGLPRAGLGVDAENPTGATKLYESVGVRGTDRFELYEKGLA